MTKILFPTIYVLRTHQCHLHVQDMARISDLPSEIVDMILLFGRKDLLALMRVCKSIHELSESLLYEEILMTWDGCVQPSSSIGLLLRTVLERPKVALLIKHVRFRNSLKPASKPANYQLSQSLLGHVQNLIHLDRFPSPDTWIREMQKGSVPAVVAFLLSRLRKLETLELGVRFQSVRLGDVFRHVLSYSGQSTSISTFRNLKQVKLNPEACSPRAGILAVDNFISLFRLPVMQSLSFLALDTYGFDHPEVCNSILKNLEIHHSQIKEETLERLLAAVPNLKSLSCGLWCDPEPFDDRSPFFDCEALGRALKQTRLIEHLAISIKFFTSSALEVDGGGAYEKGEHWGVRGCVGSLTDLAHLKSLEIPTVVLLGWIASTSAPQLADVLPSSLRQLLLRNDLNFFYKYEWNQQACLARLSEYLSEVKTHAASLDVITVRLKDCAPEDRWDEDAKRELELLCAGAKISCSFDPPA